MLDGPALFKPDTVRRIDRVIDYFGGATGGDAPPEDGGEGPGASGDPEAPWAS
jgi:hypothetical protein